MLSYWLRNVARNQQAGKSAAIDRASGSDALLFTRGSVLYYRTYTGLQVPRPLLLRPHSCDSSLAEVVAEVLALTKMNWNTTQFDQVSPIPIRAARQVGKVLKRVSFSQADQSDYRFYS